METMYDFSQIANLFVQNVAQVCDTVGLPANSFAENIFLWDGTRQETITVDRFNVPNDLGQVNDTNGFTLEAEIVLPETQDIIRVVAVYQLQFGKSCSYWEVCDGNWNMLKGSDNFPRFLSYDELTSIIAEANADALNSILTIESEESN